MNKSASDVRWRGVAGLKIQMPQPLMDGSIEYEDGTEATMSQMAKDVTVFLAWAAEPELDGRTLSPLLPGLHHR